MRNRLRVVVLAILIAAVSYAVYAIADRWAYKQAVYEDARQRGYEVSAIRYPAHWPLDYYLPILQGVQSPEAAESLVTDADSVRYFMVPEAAAPRDTTLVQVFYFRTGRWPGAIQVIYDRAGPIGIEGADWIPESEFQWPREQALAWFSARSTSESM